MKFIAPTWDEIYTKSIILAQKIRKNESNPFDTLIGVSRGGLVLCRIISDLLDIQDLDIIKCEYYSDLGKTEKKPNITRLLQGDIAGKNVLVVDDVADTGESLVAIQGYIGSKKPKSMRLATIFTKPKSVVTPDYFVTKTSSWIIFPWELYETIRHLSRGKLRTRISKTGIPIRYIRMLVEMDSELETAISR